MSVVQKKIMAGVLSCLGLCLIFAGEAVSAERSVIVGFHKKPGISEEALVQGRGGKVKRSFRHLRTMAAKMSDQVRDNLRHDPRIAYIEEDAIIRAPEPVAMSIEYQNAWGVGHIGAEAVHNSGVTGAGVKIAVLDTGIDYTHPEFATSYAGGLDFVNNDADPFDDSYNSHGTHVSGIIAAAKNDAGVVGVAPGASIYAVKVLDGLMTGTLSSLLAGIDWAITNNMNVINMSVETPVDYQSLGDACEDAYQNGLLLVAAAGNNYSGPVLYPAAYPSVIAVSATDSNDASVPFSAVGPEVEIAAPGVGIYSTVVPDPTCAPDDPSCCFGESYCYLSGTSQAAPHVTGIAALIISSGFNLDLNNDSVSDNRDVRLQLKATALDLGISGPDTVYGYGLVQATPSLLQPPPVTHLIVTKDKTKPWQGAKAVRLSGAEFEIKVENSGLSLLMVAVYDEKKLVKNLSTVLRFHRKNTERTLSIDATVSEYKVVFVPEGKKGTFADVFIRQVP